MILTEAKVHLEYNAGTSISGARIKRLGTGFSGNSTSTTDTISGGEDWVRFDLTESDLSVDDEIAASDVAYYLVEVNVAAGTTSTDWVRVSIDGMDGTTSAASAAGAAFTWKDGSEASAKYPLRLNSTSIDGDKIEETV